MSVYFNDNEKFVCDWLGNLYPQSTVDNRSISDVLPTDVASFNRAHFFAGIGGWEYALSLAEWPEGREVWTGSCPCQPFSTAGKQKGESDERHLWPEFLRLIRERRPATIFGEQVASPLGRQWLSGVRADLEALGYAVGAADLCAASVGAPHIRQRLYWVANSSGQRPLRINSLLHGMAQGRNEEGCTETAGRGAVGGMGDTDIQGSQGRIMRPGEDSSQFTPWERSSSILCSDGKTRRIPTEPEFFPLAHGVPGRVGRIRAYGNAIPPYVAAQFVRAFMETER